MFLSKKSKSGIYSYDEVYSCFQKSIRRGYYEIAEKMGEEFESQELLRKRLIYVLCEDCFNFEILIKLMLSPEESVKKYIKILSELPKNRYGSDIGRLSLIMIKNLLDTNKINLLKDKFYKFPHNLSFIEHIIEDCLDIIFGNEKNIIAKFINILYKKGYEINLIHKIFKTLLDINKIANTDFLFSMSIYSYLIDKSLSIISSIYSGEKNDIDEDKKKYIKDMEKNILPDYTFDKHTAKFYQMNNNKSLSRKDKYKLFYDNLITNYKQFPYESPFQIGEGELWKLFGYSDIKKILHFANYISKKYYIEYGISKQDLIDQIKSKIDKLKEIYPKYLSVQTQLITAKYKSPVYFINNMKNDGNGFVFKYLSSTNYLKDYYNYIFVNYVKKLIGVKYLETIYLGFENNKPFIITNNIIGKIDYTNYIVKNSKIEKDVKIYNGNKFIFSHELLKKFSDNEFIELMKNLFVRMILSANDTTERNLIYYNGHIYSIDDNSLHRDKFNKLWKGIVKKDDKEMYEKLLNKNDIKIKELIKKINNFVDKYNFSASMTLSRYNSDLIIFTDENMKLNKIPDEILI